MTARAAGEPAPLRIESHSVSEDFLALLIGAFLMSWGIVLIHAVSGVSGGLAGLAFVGSYLTGSPVGTLYFLINIPFYLFAFKRMGWRFTLKTLATVALIAGFTWVIPTLITIDHIQPLFACLFGGVVLGLGMIIVFRHGASAGGFGIIAAYIQVRFGLRAGFVQGALDLIVVIAAIPFVSPLTLLFSAAGVVILNVIIAMNHRPGRYAALRPRTHSLSPEKTKTFS